MKHVVKLLGLLLLLLVAQQGAVIHELGHVSGGRHAVSASSSVLDSSCAQCPGFSQVVSPAFSHAFYAPSLIRTAYVLTAEPIDAATDTAAPRPRSRGPPI